MRRQRLVAIFASLVCAAAGAVLPSTGCGGSGVTPVCTYPDGALDPEAGCGTPVEAGPIFADSSEDALADHSPASEDAPGDTNLAAVDASDASESVDADAHVTDATEDAHIEDAHSDSKG